LAELTDRRVDNPAKFLRDSFPRAWPHVMKTKSCAGSFSPSFSRAR
jgi:hypothetical protein